MTSILARDLQQRVPLLAEQFRKADPFPHVLIKDFVEPSFLDRLIREFPAFDHGKALNEYGEVGSKAVHENLAPLGEAYRHLDELFASPDMLGLIGGITGIPDLLYDPEYVGGGTHDNRHGQELDPHVDFNFHPTNRWHRRLNLILFLNEEWRAEWGGSLQVHSDPWERGKPDRVKSYLPLANHCVLFETSEVSWHGFPKIDLPENRRDLSRRSIAVYFYTKSRPKEQTAPDHSTVYVPRPLPDKFRAGHKLSNEDAGELKIAVQRRDRQMKFLYEREKEFSLVIEGCHWRIGEHEKEIDKLQAIHREQHEEIGKMVTRNRELHEEIENLKRKHADAIYRIFRSPTFRLGYVLSWPARVLKGLFGT